MSKLKTAFVLCLFLLLQGCYTTVMGGKTTKNQFFNLKTNTNNTKTIKRHFGFFGLISYDKNTVNINKICGGKNPKSFGTMHSGVDITIDIVGGILTFGLLPLFYSQTTVFVQC